MTSSMWKCGPRMVNFEIDFAKQEGDDHPTAHFTEKLLWSVII